MGHCSVLDQASAAWIASVILEGHAEPRWLPSVSVRCGSLRENLTGIPTGVVRAGLAVLEDANS